MIINSVRNLLTILTIITLGGCGISECLDSKIVRPTKPVNKDFNIQLILNGKSMSMNVRCEEYYEAMCNERGNYWSLREVGKDHESQTSIFSTSDSRLGQVEFPVPDCRSMVRNGRLTLSDKLITINNEPYWLKSSKGNRRTFKSSTRPNYETKVVDVDLQLKINDVPIE
ncbi:hypothetical protein OYT1_ch0552 [Ferriphaselus amnicola]|uniref:Lipoprotein n=1 Tax=Ferriphaselus amnicola TaxID=1188319 RepID=A0A2Z6G9U1_9PROT|nr:hypothetical protein OYT1_ch0552 [Ferriphaselus amnicola]